MKKYIIYVSAISIVTTVLQSPTYAGTGISRVAKSTVVEVSKSRHIKARRLPYKQAQRLITISNKEKGPARSPLRFNERRNQYHYYVERNEDLALIERGRPISKDEISGKSVIERAKKEKEEETNSLSSYKMPIYEKKKK